MALEAMAQRSNITAAPVRNLGAFQAPRRADLRVSNSLVLLLRRALLLIQLAPLISCIGSPATDND